MKIYYKACGFQYDAEKTANNTCNVFDKTQILPPILRIPVPFSPSQQCRSCQLICRLTDCLFQSFRALLQFTEDVTIIRSCMLRGPSALQQISAISVTCLSVRFACRPPGVGEVPSGCRPPTATRRTRETPALAFNHPQAPAPDRNDSWL